MRLATAIILFALLTTPAFPAAVQAGPDSPGGLLHPSDASIESIERLHEQAEAQIVQNDFAGAIRTYSEILLIEPDDETAYVGLGNCYLVQGQYKKADQSYRYALSINPENESAILGLQRILDPDGTEGMIHPLQVEAEAFETGGDTVPAPAPAPATETARPKPQPLPLSGKTQAPAFSREKPQVQAPAPKNPRTAPSEKAQAAPAAPAAAAAAAPKRRAEKLEPRPPVGIVERIGPEETRPLPPIPVRTAVSAQAAPKKRAVIEPVPITVVSKKKTAPAPAAAPARTPSASDAATPREIQKALRNTGFYSGPIDGVLGPVSRKAVKDFQVLHELAPDGVVGPKTWSSLRLYLD